MKVSFIITTRNRKDELLKTLTSCFEQDYAHFDVHVVDDCSEDGTFDSVKELFPRVIISRNDRNIGSIPSRNILLNRTDADLIVGLDDDSRFITQDSITKVVRRFLNEPDLGLIQFQEQGPQFPETLKPGGLETGEWHIAAFASNRYALRKSILIKTGLFQDIFFHMYEEPDLALRIWDAGYRCLHWNDIVVWHEFSNLNRNLDKIRYLHIRNEQLSIWLRVPWSYLLPSLIKKAISQILYNYRNGKAIIVILGILASFSKLHIVIKQRKTVSKETLRRCILLSRNKVISPEAVWKLGKR